MLDDLLLLRLWAAPDAAWGETRSRVAADLRSIAGDPSGDGQSWAAVFTAAVGRLAQAGCLTTGGRAGARLLLSEAGRGRVQSVFKIPANHASAHAGRRRTAGWVWWRDHYALPLALDGEAAGTTDDLRSTLLRRFYPQANTAEARGNHPDRLTKMVDLLLAKRLKASQASPGAFRQAVLREWVQPAPAPAAGAPPSTVRPGEGSAQPAAGRLPDDLSVFARQALLAARRSPTGRFGDAKVFVSHVWRGLLAAGQAAPEELAGFRERLVRANTAGLLQLSRADLAGAHDPEDVRASELHYLGEKFHFVRLD